MNRDEQDILVDNYLNGDVSEEEFQSALKKHPELKDLLELHRDVDRFFAEEESSDYEKFVRSAIAPQQKRRFLIPNPLLAAAMIAVVFGFFFAMYYLLDEPMSAQEVFASHFEAYESVGLQRGNDAYDEHYQMALLLYDQERYEEAIRYFESSQKMPSLGGLYLGISYLAVGESQKAIDSLTPFAVDKSLIQDAARWYLALAYVQMDARDKAKNELAPLANNPNSHWYEKAKDLVEDL